jgi:hypothetical protein
MILLALGFAILFLIHFGTFILRAAFPGSRASERRACLCKPDHERRRQARRLVWPQLVWSEA